MNLLRIPSFRGFLPQIAAILTIVGAPLFGEPTDAKQTTAAEGKPTSTAAQPNKKRVYVGMPAAELQALIGKPEKIIPVPRKSDKDEQAEIWVYRRLIKSYTENVTIGSKPITSRRPNGDGTSSDVVLLNEPVTQYRLTEVFQVARFLIANGQYVATTQYEEQQQTFQ